MSSFELLMFHKPPACVHAVVSSADVTGPVICSLLTFYGLCAAPLWRPIKNKTTVRQRTEHNTTASMALPNELFLHLQSTRIRARDKPFTDCLSSSSCLRSQSASERTMVSWGSEEEEASPLLEVVTSKERGVRGIKVSSSILCSCCDETNSFWVTLQLFSAPMSFVHIIANTPLHGTSSPPLPPPSVLFPTPPSAFPAPFGTSPVTMATDMGNGRETY